MALKHHGYTYTIGVGYTFHVGVPVDPTPGTATARARRIWWMQIGSARKLCASACACNSVRQVFGGCGTIFFGGKQPLLLKQTKVTPNSTVFESSPMIFFPNFAIWWVPCFSSFFLEVSFFLETVKVDGQKVAAAFQGTLVLWPVSCSRLFSYLFKRTLTYP